MLKIACCQYVPGKGTGMIVYVVIYVFIKKAKNALSITIDASGDFGELKLNNLSQECLFPLLEGKL